MSRRVYLLGAGLALVALALAVTDWALSLRPGVTEANAKRIRPGMTVQQVEGLMGGPADYTGPPIRWTVFEQSGPRVIISWVGFWTGIEGYAAVFFDQHGRVERADFDPDPSNPPGPLARLRAWLGW